MSQEKIPSRNPEPEDYDSKEVRLYRKKLQKEAQKGNKDARRKSKLPDGHLRSIMSIHQGALNDRRVVAFKTLTDIMSPGKQSHERISGTKLLIGIKAQKKN